MSMEETQGTSGNLSRADFLKRVGKVSAVVGGVAVAPSLLAGCGKKAEGRALPAGVEKWDKEVDVVVVGYGYAGANAALAAKMAGSSVLLVEKAPEGGGNSAASVGMLHTCIKVDPAKLDEFTKQRIEGAIGTVDPKVITQYVKDMQETTPWLEKDLGLKLSWMVNPANGQAMARIEVNGKAGQGMPLWKAFADLVDSKDVEVMLSTAATRLIQDFDTKEILGLVVSKDGKDAAIKANKGVILACGGYENNMPMKDNYQWPGVTFGQWGTPYNTGDGITMAAAVAADMWHFSCVEFAGLMSVKAYKDMKACFTLVHAGKDFYAAGTAGNFILVNKYGKRFWNEGLASGHQKTTFTLLNYDGVKAEYANLPAYFVFDESLRQAQAVCPTPLFGGLPFTYAYWSTKYEWSKDNSTELDKGWIIKGDSIDDLAKKTGIDPAGLAATIAKFNASAAAGADAEFGRDPKTMAPLATGPFYAMEVGPMFINTMGGPKRNEKCQVIGLDGQPIARLYSAGELGSFNGGVDYILGNIAEAVTTGRVAGKDAASLQAWV